jgi:hypothetical protein
MASLLRLTIKQVIHIGSRGSGPYRAASVSLCFAYVSGPGERAAYGCSAAGATGARHHCDSSNER